MGINKWCVGFVPVRSSSSTLEEILGVEIFHQTRRFTNLSAENKRKLEEWGFCFDENNVARLTPIPWNEGIRFLKSDPRHIRFVLDDGRIVFEAFIKNTHYEKSVRFTVNNKKAFDDLYEKIYCYLKRLELLNADINLREDINSLVGKLQHNLKINDNDETISSTTAADTLVDTDFIRMLANRHGEGGEIIADCCI